MACMEHSCMSCPYMDFNNEPRTPSVCPKCGGQMSHHWDEQYSDLDYSHGYEEEEEP